ncbi:transporter substrate-binding domain-containing protein [Xylanimonas allomyrinae]|uniref:Transporter substrate-binding domain-containing protein n=1 Tax=Xylanimonas allomyrinae TaxID=2509459 RepID=A0A4P6EJD2_9MICO|nr:transporter substrate-binding domain-containing protein [Xylanimonas allomyrinae]QAY62146.1 transporter substrate-binding domain-containing protein [Xylanimonas allomyrinae]
MDKATRVKRLVAGASIVMVASLLGACGLIGGGRGGGSESGETNSSLARIQKSGELRYGVIVGEEPGFIRADDGEWTGYLADTAQLIAKQLDLKPVPVETTWGNMALDLQANKIDIAVGAQPTGERALVVDYTTHPLYTNYFSIIVTSDQFDRANWTELNTDGVTVGVQTGDSTIQPLKQFAPAAKTLDFDSRDKNLLALEAGHVDASANTLLNALMASKSRTDMNAHVVVPEPLVAAPSAAMVARSTDQAFLKAVDAVVWNLNSSGQIRSAILEHLKTYGITEADLPMNATL